MRVPSGEIRGALTALIFIRSSAVKSFFPSFARGAGASFLAGFVSSGVFSCAETKTAVAIRQSKTLRAIAKCFRFIMILLKLQDSPVDVVAPIRDAQVMRNAPQLARVEGLVR